MDIGAGMPITDPGAYTTKVFPSKIGDEKIIHSLRQAEKVRYSPPSRRAKELSSICPREDIT